MSEGFFSRWSRRKQAAEKGADLPEDAAPPAEPAAAELPQPAPVLEPSPAPVAAAAEEEFDISTLPPVESLTAESDFSAFLKPGVPGWLKTAALRKAWVLDAAIRDYRSPLDYGWDFNTPGGLPAGFSADLGVVGEQLKKLIAQAVGAPPEPEPAPEADPPVQGGEAALALAPDGAPPAFVPPAFVPPAFAPPAFAPPDPGPPNLLSSAGAGEAAAPALPAPEAVPAMTSPSHADAPVERAEPRRRHGKALPS